jgi:hypothetical protein
MLSEAPYIAKLCNRSCHNPLFRDLVNRSPILCVILLALHIHPRTNPPLRLALCTPRTPHPSVNFLNLPFFFPHHVPVEFLDPEDDVLEVVAGLGYALFTRNVSMAFELFAIVEVKGASMTDFVPRRTPPNQHLCTFQNPGCFFSLLPYFIALFLLANDVVVFITRLQTPLRRCKCRCSGRLVECSIARWCRSRAVGVWIQDGGEKGVGLG